jgi:trimethylamine--corrinoid protein Co-methyltransferase
VLDGFGCASYEKLILDFEIIDFVNQANAEFEINDETLALEVMGKIGHGGQYLTAPHTFKFCRREPTTSNISVRGHVRDAMGQVEVNIKKRINDLYKKYEKPKRNETILSAMKAIMMREGIEPSLIKNIDSQ